MSNNHFSSLTPEGEGAPLTAPQQIQELFIKGGDKFLQKPSGRPRTVVAEYRKSLAVKAETDEEMKTQQALMRLSLSFSDEQLSILNRLALATPEQYGEIARTTNYSPKKQRHRFIALIERPDAQEYIRLIRNSYISVPNIVDKAQKLFEIAVRDADYKAANEALKLLATYKGMLVDRKITKEEKTIDDRSFKNYAKMTQITNKDVDKVKQENNNLANALAAVVGAKVIPGNPITGEPSMIIQQPYASPAIDVQ